MGGGHIMLGSQSIVGRGELVGTYDIAANGGPGTVNSTTFVPPYTNGINLATDDPMEIFEIEFFSGTYEAWNPWGIVNLPTNGYRTYMYSFIDPGPLIYYRSFNTAAVSRATTAEALADAIAAGPYYLWGKTNYYFAISDNPLTDNTGGVSFRIWRTVLG